MQSFVVWSQLIKEVSVSKNKITLRHTSVYMCQWLWNGWRTSGQESSRQVQTPLRLYLNCHWDLSGAQICSGSKFQLLDLVIHPNKTAEESL